MSAESLREQIAATLAEHHDSAGWMLSDSDQTVYACQCGDYYVAGSRAIRYAVVEAAKEWHRQHLADAVLAALGEVTVTEEWAPQRRGRDVHPADVRHDRGGAAEWCFPGSGMTLVRRSVVTTRRVGEWEEVQ